MLRVVEMQNPPSRRHAALNIWKKKIKIKKKKRTAPDGRIKQPSVYRLGIETPCSFRGLDVGSLTTDKSSQVICPQLVTGFSDLVLSLAWPLPWGWGGWGPRKGVPLPASSIYPGPQSGFEIPEHLGDAWGVTFPRPPSILTPGALGSRHLPPGRRSESSAVTKKQGSPPETGEEFVDSGIWTCV